MTPPTEHRVLREERIAPAALEVTWHSLSSISSEQWTQLEERSEPSPFMRQRFLRIWARHFTCRNDARILALTSGGSFVGLLPLAQRAGRMGWPIREVLGTQAVAQLPDGLVDRVELPGVKERPEILRCLLQTTIADLAPEETLLLRYLPSGPALVDALGDDPARWRDVFVKVASVSPFIELPASWEELENCWSSWRRKRMRQLERRIFRAGRMEVRLHLGEHVGRNELQHLIQVDERSWKARSGSNHLPSGPLREFALELLCELCPRGSAGLSLLYLDSLPIAYDISLWDQHVVFSYMCAFDDAYRSLSPGTFLRQFFIRQAIQRGRQRVDFLRGDESYKTDLATGTQIEFDVLVMPVRCLPSLTQAAQLRVWPACRRRLGVMHRLLTGRSQLAPVHHAWQPWPGLIRRRP